MMINASSGTGISCRARQVDCPAHTFPRNGRHCSPSVAPRPARARIRRAKIGVNDILSGRAEPFLHLACKAEANEDFLLPEFKLSARETICRCRFLLASMRREECDVFSCAGTHL